MQDDIMYDVVLVENGRIEIVTLWKRIELERCLRLAIREGARYKSPAGVMQSGMGYIGLEVIERILEIRTPQFLFINGRKIKQKDKVIVARIFEAKKL